MGDVMTAAKWCARLSELSACPFGSGQPKVSMCYNLGNVADATKMSRTIGELPGQWLPVLFQTPVSRSISGLSIAVPRGRSDWKAAGINSCSK